MTLTRKQGESVRIGDDICVVIKEIKGKQIRLGITAPKDIYVVREELFQKIQEANLEAAKQGKEPIVSMQSIEAIRALMTQSHLRQDYSLKALLSSDSQHQAPNEPINETEASLPSPSLIDQNIIHDRSMNENPTNASSDQLPHHQKDKISK